MIKKNLPIILVISLILVSCSKSDDNAPIIPPINEDIIGLKTYGEKTNSYDESIDLFEISNGYISFENSNKYDANISQTYDGTANMVIRKLDDEFEMTNEFILETNTYDILSSVAKIDENNYVLAGRFTLDEDFFSYPFVKIVNDNGVVLKSLILSGSKLFSTISFTKTFYKDGVIYVADRLDDYFFSLIALDLNLNELWRKDFPNARGNSAIYVNDDYVYFGMVHDASMTIELLEIVDGAHYKSFNLNPVGEINSIEKIIEHNNNLYLIGGGIPVTSTSLYSDGCIVGINKDNGQVFDEIYVEEMHRINDIAISGNDLLVVGYSKTNENVVKIDKEGDVLWSYKVKTNTFGGEFFTVINSQNGIIFSGGLRLNNTTDRSTDAVYGMLDDSGRLK